MGLLLLALRLLFWSPMVLRIARRKTPETTIVDELTSSFRIPGLVMYAAGLALTWVGLAVRGLTYGFDPNFTVQVFAGIFPHLLGIGLTFSAFTVHQSWNIQPRLEPDHQLWTIGPYGLVPHPIYVAFDRLGLGAAVWEPSVAVVPGAVVPIAGGDWRARTEERVLTDTFGDQYQDYMRRPHRAIPGVY